MTFDRERLVQARRSLLEAIVSYRLAAADLRRQTLYDFAVGRSLVVDDRRRGRSSISRGNTPPGRP